MTLHIRIASDFICPWCFIGERRLMAALRDLPESTDVSIEWLPFELNPDMQPEGIDRKIYRSLKFGSWERSQLLDQQTEAAADGDDLAFDYPAITKTPNTFLAHRLMQFAQRRGGGTALANALFSAYFERGQDIGDRETLILLAVGAGLGRAEVEAFLASDEGIDELRAIELQLRSGGVRGVPNFEFEGQVVSGAQPIEVLSEALKNAAARIRQEA
ncbi:DsbA family oxidoreductase [Salinicola sp. V024]|uniref:DsbA family oxidoreductase n=1 Tax=Salinicola sp. V024 TaxID=3459609 RepID=UPI0040439612